MTKGEKRFEDLLLRCLFPKGVPVGHVVPNSPQHAVTRRAIHLASKDIAIRNGIEIMDDVDDELDP